MNQSLKKSDLVVATKEEAFWIRAKEHIDRTIKEHEDILKFQRAALEMAESKLKKAKKEKT
ncbi:MAG: hypothetical protein KAJ19_26020 [Gammaproteobacteria bacterium]|nr:hypothetical protein [Gammaproteobacteria bacterium]